MNVPKIRFKGVEEEFAFQTKRKIFLCIVMYDTF